MPDAFRPGEMPPDYPIDALLTPDTDAPAERERLPDWRLFLDAAEMYAERAREMRELFNDPAMGEPSSERAARFYALGNAARAARGAPPADG